jgi:hypothetical protein
MTVETWYRGEGIGVPPSEPGKNSHDLGDGMYLTDTESVALQYAKTRAKGEAPWQVVEVRVERQSLGRVLDLTMDPRWLKFMTEPMFPGMNHPDLKKSRLDHLRIKYELYDQFFKEFQKANKIDIKEFDAVIGPEYVRGGKQLCILHKNGLPTKLNIRIRSLFRSRMANFAFKPPSNWPRAIGRALISIGIGLVIAYVVSKITQRINDSVIRQKMEEFLPEFEKFAAAMRVNIVDRLAHGEGAYVSAYIELDFDMIPNQDWLNPDYLTGPPLVHIAGLTVTATDVSNTPVKHTKDKPGLLSGGTWQDLHYFWISCKPPVEKEEVERYRAILERIKWCEDTLKSPNIAESDRSLIEKERIELKQSLDEPYPPINYKPNRVFWTEDAYSDMMRLGWGSEPAKV